jgi:hypothetical protein
MVELMLDLQANFGDNKKAAAPVNFDDANSNSAWNS